MIKKLILILGLLLVMPSYAKWTHIIDYNGDSFYADLNTLKRSGDTVTIWHLMDYKYVKNIFGDPLLSSRHLIEYDCSNYTYVEFKIFYHTQNKGQGGFYPYTSWRYHPQWSSLIPNIVMDDLFRFVCNKSEDDAEEMDLDSLKKKIRDDVDKIIKDHQTQKAAYLAKHPGKLESEIKGEIISCDPRGMTFGCVYSFKENKKPTAKEKP